MRSLVRPVFGLVDQVYRTWHGLMPVGPLLFVGHGHHDGPARRFADGTELGTGDPVGVLHLNNARLAALSGPTPAALGLQFRRLLFVSLRALADLPRHDETFAEVAVYRGLGWVRHGRRIGFVHEPAKEGWRNRCVRAHVRLLVWVFAPPGGTALDAPRDLTVSWLTRRALEERFGGDRGRGESEHNRPRAGVAPVSQHRPRGSGHDAR